MDTIIPVQIKIFPGNREELAKVPGADEETKSHLHWKLACLARNYPGIIVRQHHTDEKQRGLLKEQCETFKISCLTGRHPMKGCSECPLTDK